MHYTATDLKALHAAAQTYKQLINTRVATYSQQLEQVVSAHYGAEAQLAITSLTSILARDGKRLRGSLVLLGHEMCGGTDRDMPIQAAAAVEILHACLLILDDIQDRSDTRRGGPSAHAMLREHHRHRKLRGDSTHIGEALAINAATAGLHLAQSILAELDTEPARVVKAMRIINQAIVVTAHGQTQDMMNEILPDVSLPQTENVLEWKTAHYTLTAPLQAGMALAGANDKTVARLAPYALAAGKAFQLVDDVTGTFGTTAENGKNIMDDIREGKRTPLTVYALKHAAPADQEFLLKNLGNQRLSRIAFQHCRDILVSSGALAYCRTQAEVYLTEAANSLDDLDDICPPKYKSILRGLAGYLLERLEKL